MSALHHYYIYYRVNEKNADEAEHLIRTMQTRLACRSGTGGRLLKRRSDPGLWMEVYENVADPQRFEFLLRQAADEYDIEMLLDGTRKQECFVGETAPHAGGCKL